MIRHIAWVFDEFLMEHSFVITDPGPGQRRTAVRGDLSYEIGPRCRCDYCPESQHPNYRCIAGVAS
jgi:hypothetical protein